jgi:hypothetical protein
MIARRPTKTAFKRAAYDEAIAGKSTWCVKDQYGGHMRWKTKKFVH